MCKGKSNEKKKPIILLILATKIQLQRQKKNNEHEWEGKKTLNLFARMTFSVKRNIATNPKSEKIKKRKKSTKNPTPLIS